MRSSPARPALGAIGDHKHDKRQQGRAGNMINGSRAAPAAVERLPKKDNGAKRKDRAVIRGAISDLAPDRHPALAVLRSRALPAPWAATAGSPTRARAGPGRLRRSPAPRQRKGQQVRWTKTCGYRSAGTLTMTEPGGAAQIAPRPGTADAAHCSRRG